MADGRCMMEASGATPIRFVVVQSSVAAACGRRRRPQVAATERNFIIKKSGRRPLLRNVPLPQIGILQSEIGHAPALRRCRSSHQRGDRRTPADVSRQGRKERQGASPLRASRPWREMLSRPAFRLSSFSLRKIRVLRNPWLLYFADFLLPLCGSALNRNGRDGARPSISLS